MASWIDKKVRLRIYHRDELTCAYCGVQCKICDTKTCKDMTNAATLDHIVPQVVLARTCANDRDFRLARRNPKNLVVVCMSCNSSKCDTDLFTWCANTCKDYGAILIEIGKRISRKV